MKQKLIKCCACGKEEMRGPCAKYCTACATEIKTTSFHKRVQKRNEMVAPARPGSEESFAADLTEAERRGMSYGEYIAAVASGRDVLERKTQENLFRVLEREARKQRHDEFAKTSPVIYYTEDDSGRPFERRVFIRWYRGQTIRATARELDCPEKRVANCLHSLGCEANNGVRPKGLWELVETETGLRVRPKEVQWTLGV